MSEGHKGQLDKWKDPLSIQFYQIRLNAVGVVVAVVVVLGKALWHQRQR